MDTAEDLFGEQIKSEQDVYVRLFGLLEVKNKFGTAHESATTSSLSWSLLKYLLVNAGRDVGQDELQANLWPDKPEANAEGASRVRVRRLREALAPLRLDGRDGFVLFRKYIYSLNLKYNLHTDAELFLDLVKQVEKSETDDPYGMELCIQALQLFRGAFLEHTAPAPWLVMYRKTYHGQLSKLAWLTLMRMKSLGDDRALELLCQRSAAIIPTDHELQQALIDYMIENKRQTELMNYVSRLSQDGNLGVSVEGFETSAKTGLPTNVVSDFDIRVKMFGRVEVENQWGRVEEKPSWPSYSWALLKYLLVNPGREVSLQELLKTAWPDKPDINTEYAANIRLRRLREAVMPLHLEGRNGWIQFDSGMYFLNPEYTVWTDVSVFEKLMDQIRSKSVDESEGLELCVQALEVFHAPFLEHTEPAEWLATLRDQYNAQFVELARSTLSRMRALDDDRAITALCRDAAAILPEEESLHRAIIDYMVEQNRQIELMRYISHLAHYNNGEGVNWLNQTDDINDLL